MTGIYGIHNKATGKWYVGQAQNIKKRTSIEKACMNRHGRLHYDGNNHRLEKELKEHGLESFEFIVLEQCVGERLNERETYWIEKLDSYQNGYNLTKGGTNGSLGWHPTPEQKKHACAAQQRIMLEGKNPVVFKSGHENPMYGKGYLMRGRKYSEEALDRMRKAAALKDFRGENNPHYGKKHTEETKRMLSEITRNRKLPEDFGKKVSEAGASAKPVICIETGEKYRSCVAAAKAKGIKTPRNIGDVCRGVLKTCGGYRWKFIDRSEFYPERKKV